MVLMVSSGVQELQLLAINSWYNHHQWVVYNKPSYRRNISSSLQWNHTLSYFTVLYTSYCSVLRCYNQHCCIINTTQKILLQSKHEVIQIKKSCHSAIFIRHLSSKLYWSLMSIYITVTWLANNAIGTHVIW